MCSDQSYHCFQLKWHVHKSVPQCCRLSQPENEESSISASSGSALCGLLSGQQEHCKWVSSFSSFSGQQSAAVAVRPCFCSLQPCNGCTSFAAVGKYWHDKHHFLPLHSIYPCPEYVQPVYSVTVLSSLCPYVEGCLHPNLLSNYTKIQASSFLSIWKLSFLKVLYYLIEC